MPVTATSGTCGGLEKLAPGKAMPLLGGRLWITPPEGAVDSARPHGIMDAPPSSAAETRLMLERGHEKLVVFSEEIFARSGPDLKAALERADSRIAGLPIQERTLASGLRALVVTHPELDASTEAVPIAHAYTVLADDTLQVTHVFVSPEVVRAGSSGCAALGQKLLETLAPGTQRLDLAGGPRTLDSGYTLTLPSDFALVPQRGPDFVVYRVFPVRSISVPTGQLGLYFGGSPSFHVEPNAETRSGTLLGGTVTWYAVHTENGERRETLVERNPNLRIHVFIDAPAPSDADELQRIAETLAAPH